MQKLTIQLSDDVVEACEHLVNKTTFDTVEEYVEFVVEETVSVDQSGTDSDDSASKQADQLRALGYLD